MLGTKDVFPNKINVPQKATVLQEQEEEVGAFFVILYIDSGLWVVEIIFNANIPFIDFNNLL